ncbi:Ger(x)C family spore germination protein [Paenibacillus cremeus]|uniref:Ger(X)C family spore germination protein n=1 Tax=Paenibacillus cremeus TaxID=2163881 RepID=A0A559K6N9_9BACL|nr:Ger(x)C family spore germination protein [Paenibacillus cremeus]TVY07805.1 Ger(x)C family spore germination protein [Paenibacillus cremeus]
MKVIKFGLILALTSLLLSGCWDKMELEDQAYVVVLGLDLAKEKNLLDVTFQIANPQVGSTDKSSAPNEPPSDTVTFTAPDILSAKELANSVVTRKLSFAHLRTLVIGEKLARSQLLSNALVASIRDPELRRETNFIVSAEQAVNFIHNNKPKLETRPHKYYAFMQQRWRDTGHVPYATLNRFMTRVNGELFLAIYGTTERKNSPPKIDEDDYLAGQISQVGGDPVQIMGSAVLKNGVMIGKLTGEETRHALLLRRKAINHDYVASFPDPLNKNFRVTLRVMKRGNTDIKINVKKDPPTIDVTVPIKTQLLSIPSLINYATNLEKQRQFVSSIKEHMEKESQAIIAKSQREFKSEPFVWYVEARKQFWTLQEFEKYDWENQFAKATVNVKFDVSLESFGKQTSPHRIEQKE